MARVPGGGGKRRRTNAAPAHKWPKSRPRYAPLSDSGRMLSMGGKIVPGPSGKDKKRYGNYRKNTQTQLNSLRKVKHR
jgi:hypothetical protein